MESLRNRKDFAESHTQFRQNFRDDLPNIQSMSIQIYIHAPKAINIAFSLEIYYIEIRNHCLNGFGHT